MTEELELAALEKQFQRAEHEIEEDRYSSFDSESRKSSISGYSTPSSFNGSQAQLSYASASPMFSHSPADIFRLHENLNARLQPFWSRSLSNRTLRISIYTRMPSNNGNTNLLDSDDSDYEDPGRVPVSVKKVTSNAQGAFEARIHIPWDKLCVHPGALHIAFGDAKEEPELYVCAELLPPPNRPGPHLEPERVVRSVLPVALSHSQIRLISDIDDTIKLSNILGGARKIFHNVFVRSLEESVIEGMGDWYSKMWSQGVRFHYVVSPFICFANPGTQVLHSQIVLTNSFP
jgi:hypothetical protein